MDLFVVIWGLLSNRFGNESVYFGLRHSFSDNFRC
jgi:hypothetical protein